LQEIGHGRYHAIVTSEYRFVVNEMSVANGPLERHRAFGKLGTEEQRIDFLAFGLNIAR
jgi:hypothetical protein